MLVVVALLNATLIQICNFKFVDVFFCTGIQNVVACPIRWLVSRRSRDLALLSQEGSFNETELAYMLQLREKARATIIMQTICTSDPSTMRQMDRWMIDLDE